MVVPANLHNVPSEKSLVFLRMEAISESELLPLKRSVIPDSGKRGIHLVMESKIRIKRFLAKRRPIFDCIYLFALSRSGSCYHWRLVRIFTRYVQIFWSTVFVSGFLSEMPVVPALNQPQFS